MPGWSDDIAGETGGIGMQHIISVIEQHGLLVVFLNVLLWVGA
jgi:hypothetical protein